MGITLIVDSKPWKIFWGFSFLGGELLLKTNQSSDVLHSVNFYGRMNSIVIT